MNQIINETGSRSQWPRLLLAVPEAEVLSAAEALVGRYLVEDMTLPQAGLGLLQLKDGAFDEAYYPGEIPLASAHVVLFDADGKQHEGAVRIMYDKAELARAIAVIDAALAGNIGGSETIIPLLQRGAALLQQQNALRKKMLVRTRVDFALLGSTEEEESDE